MLMLLASAFTVLFTVHLLPAMAASVEVEKVIVSGGGGGGRNAMTQIRSEKFVAKSDADDDDEDLLKPYVKTKQVGCFYNL